MKFKIVFSSENKFQPTQTGTNFENMLFTTFNNASKLRLVSASIPITYYSVNSTNNVIYFNENIGANATANITAGSYTTTSLATVIGTVMTAASPNGRTYTVTYSNTLNAFTITVSAGTFRFSFGTNVTNSAFRVLGFNNTDGVLALTQTSPNQPQLNLTSVICLRSAELAGRLIKSNVSNQINDNVLYIMPVTVALGDLLTYYNQDSDYYEIDMKNCNKFDIMLTDLSGNILDIRGLNTYFEFELISQF